MTCSTSSSNRALVAWQLLALLALSSCALFGRQEAAPLEFGSLTSERDGPAVAGSTTIRWTATSTGGAGQLRYVFTTFRGSAEIVEQEGPSPTWDWNPSRAGTYQVRVAVEDGAGARVESGWSSAIVVLPAFDRSDLIALLPIDNLTGRRAPLEAVRRSLHQKLSEKGIRLLEDDVLDEFMKRYRIRNVRGVNSHVSSAMKEETGAEALLITSLEGFQDRDPPKVSMFSRLVSTGERPEIAWMEGVGLAGDTSPGILGLRRVGDPEILMDRAIQCLADSLEKALSAPVLDDRDATPPNVFNECGPRGNLRASSPEELIGRRFRPRSFFRSPMIDASRRYRVAVVPFLNLSERRNAGDIVALHFVDQLIRNEFLTVIEPGLVTEQLLRYRIIMKAGPSLANAEILWSRVWPPPDLVFSGTVFDYQDAVGIPIVDFSVKIFEKTSRRVVWSSRSQNNGMQGVFWFDLRRVRTAHRLASAMARGTFEVFNR